MAKQVIMGDGVNRHCCVCGLEVSASDKDVAAKVLGEEIKYSDLDKGNRLEIYEAKKKLHELQNAELERNTDR